MIANNEQYFDVLMSLLDLTKEVSTRALEMIEMLVTSPILYDRVIKLDAEDQAESFSWSRIFDGSNVHKMLYCLEIVEAILVRDQEKRSTHDWVSRFLELQGFEQLQSLLTGALASIKESELMNDRKKYVRQLFKLIRIFVLASSQNQAV
jgi:hypothetical protein